MQETVLRGSWVQIERVVLRPEQRAPHIPEETRKVPLKLWAKGFLEQDANIGDTVAIRTSIGRCLTGKLLAVNPPYVHGFGRPIPELLEVGEELRSLIAKEESR
jgi:hypothetical protein